MLTIRQIFCKTLLNKSTLGNFTLNCYVGCTHKCLYCYARYMKKFKERPEEWGDFVDIKINACEVLKKQLKKIRPPQEVFMSSVGDAWQPLEAKYRLSRDSLKLLLEAGLQVTILTKSSLIERDFDILTCFKTVNLGMTITTLDKSLQRVLEPLASSTQERLNTLKKAQDKGIKIWVFLGPLLPEFTDTYSNLEALFKAISGLNLDYIYIDRLNLRWKVLEALRRGLSTQDYLKWRLLFYKCINPQRYADYSQLLKKKAEECAVRFDLLKKLKFCF